MLPIVYVEGDVLPEVWERAVVEVYKRGVLIDSEYGQKCKEATAVLIVRKPLEEPRVHVAGILDFKSLFEYIDEVLEGISDWRIGKDWHYTYHERLRAYKAGHGEVVDQIAYILEKLKKVPYSRRAVAITWQPWRDEWVDSPPCLQFVQARVIKGRLHLWTFWRSRDLFKAWFYNAFAMSEMMRYMAKELGVEVGIYYDMSTSLHIYERDFEQVEKLVRLVKEGRSRTKWITTDLTARRAKFEAMVRQSMLP